MTEEKLTEDLSKMNIETSGIVAKTPKNWNDLPPEIKLEVIQFMNFKERTRLRQTSHTEKRLVDALRYDFDNVDCTEKELSLYRANPQEYYSIPTQRYGISDILKFLKIRNFTHAGKIHINQNEPGLIQAKRFHSVWNFDSAKEVVKNLWNKTEIIRLDLDRKPISIDEFMNISQIKKVPDLRLNCANKIQVVPLIQKWIETDKELGSKLEIDCEHDCSDELAAKFGFQKISQQNSTIRIGNGKTVIFDFKAPGRFEIYCTVISSK